MEVFEAFGRCCLTLKRRDVVDRPCMEARAKPLAGRWGTLSETIIQTLTLDCSPIATATGYLVNGNAKEVATATSSSFLRLCSVPFLLPLPLHPLHISLPSNTPPTSTSLHEHSLQSIRSYLHLLDTVAPPIGKLALHPHRLLN